MLLPLVSACKKAPAREEMIKEVIVKYDIALIEAYRRLTIRPVEKVASDLEVSKNNAILLGFYQDKIFMESHLEDIKFRNIKFESDTKAEARVTEKWRWRHLHRETKKEVKPWVESEQKLRYHLVKDPKKGWIVDSVEFVK